MWYLITFLHSSKSDGVGLVFFTKDTILLKLSANLSAYNSPSKIRLGFLSNTNFISSKIWGADTIGLPFLLNIPSFVRIHLIPSNFGWE